MRQFRFAYLFVILFLVVLGHYSLYAYMMDGKFQDMRKQLMLFASSAALLIDGDAVLQIPLRMEGDKTPAYKVIFQQLERIKANNPSLKYVYIMTPSDQLGVLQYVVDADPVPAIITAKSPTAFPGDKYDARQAPEMLEAFNQPAADKKLITDTWGFTLSGYAPIRGSSGRAVAILGVDMDANAMYAAQKVGQHLLTFVAATGILCAVAFLLRI